MPEKIRASKLNLHGPKIKTISLDEMKDEFIGRPGTAKRNKYEGELNKKVLTRKRSVKINAVTKTI